MSEFPMVSESELQSIEGGGTVYLGAILLEAVVNTVISTAVALKNVVP